MYYIKFVDNIILSRVRTFQTIDGLDLKMGARIKNLLFEHSTIHK